MQPLSTTQEILAAIATKKAERNWAALGNIYRTHLERFIARLEFARVDFVARIHAGRARDWDALEIALREAKNNVSQRSFFTEKEKRALGIA